MRTARLTRFRTDEDGTFGVLSLDNGAFMFTLEPELMDNQSNISCIPTGSYKVIRRFSNKYGETYHITNVPNRSYILIHSGNIEDNTEGCVMVGLKSGVYKEKKAVLESKSAVSLLEESFNKEEFFLTVLDSY